MSSTGTARTPNEEPIEADPAPDGQLARLAMSLDQAIGISPTRVEIAVHFGWASANSAKDHIQALARQGAILVLTGTARGIRLTRSAQGFPDEHAASEAEQSAWRSAFPGMAFEIEIGRIAPIAKA